MSTPGRLVLLGHPVAHSLSPLFQNALLQRAEIPLTYHALDVEPHALRTVLSDLVAADGAGNVTVPLKDAVASHCDWVTPIAARVGAVNTFWSEDGRLFGDNTDVGGFLAAVRTHAPQLPRGARVVLLGAGGSAAAVLAACEQLDVERVDILARTPERARSLADRFAPFSHVAEDPAALIGSAHLVVNATPVGMGDGRHPVAVSAIDPSSTVIDLTYRRGETPWVLACRERGLNATDGLTMLVEQGALAFLRWFPHSLASDEIRRLIWDAVGERR